MLAHDIISFFFMAESYSVVYMDHIFLFIYVGHLGCPPVLAIVNSAAINIGAHVSFRITVFFRHVHRSGLAGADGSSVFTF